ncbi:hypothetical protein [Ammoniphilus sp. 3BR4]|uniref:hypothetical protein n=1 Tax=Ammoniphilus sp. 3BR4 TaxID=3158265 RepID=UPI003466454A
MRREGQKRKIRSDKKRDVKPTVSIELYECMNRLSYITVRPVKDIAEDICRVGTQSQEVITGLSYFFRRDFYFTNNFGDSICFRGSLDRAPIKIDRGTGAKGRLSLRFPPHLFETVKELSYALDLTVSSATTLLIESVLQETDFVSVYLEEYIKEELDPHRLHQLEEVVAYINQFNPEKDTTVAKILHLIWENMKDRTQSMKKAVDEWLKENTD